MYLLVGALGVAVGIIVGHWLSERFWQPILLELLSKVPGMPVYRPQAQSDTEPAEEQLMDEESADEDRQTRDKRAPRAGWNFWS